jgi:hypothetical protein
MLTEEHGKEDLSRAYVQAVGARAGIIVSLNRRGHDYGIDGSFHQVSILDGNRVESGYTRSTSKTPKQIDSNPLKSNKKTRLILS